jgi:hypothetical protein
VFLNFATNCSSPRWYMSVEPGGIISTGENGRTRRKSWPHVTLSATNPTWTHPGANQSLHGVKDRRLTAYAMARPLRYVCRLLLLLILHLFNKSFSTAQIMSTGLMSKDELEMIRMIWYVVVTHFKALPPKMCRKQWGQLWNISGRIRITLHI